MDVVNLITTEDDADTMDLTSDVDDDNDEVPLLDNNKKCPTKGLHFIGEEPKVIRDLDGNIFAISMEIRPVTSHRF